MTTATPTPTPTGAPLPAQLEPQLAQALAEALRQAISVQADAPWSSRVLEQTQEVTAEQQETATVSLRLSGGLTGELFLSLENERLC